MKKIAIILMLVGGLVLPSTVQAGPINTGDTLQIDYNLGTWGGGPMAAVDITTSFDFWTFCLEKDEHVALDTNYYVKLSDQASLGGMNTDAGDPLDSMTAYLYWQFLIGTFGNPATMNQDDRDGLQLAIWRIEQEVDTNYLTLYTGGLALNPVPSTDTITRANYYYDLALANANGSLYGVEVVQLWTNSDFTGVAQDIVVRVPDGGATLMLLGGALMGLGALRRKFRG